MRLINVSTLFCIPAAIISCDTDHNFLAASPVPYNRNIRINILEDDKWVPFNFNQQDNNINAVLISNLDGDDSVNAAGSALRLAAERSLRPRRPLPWGNLPAGRVTKPKANSSPLLSLIVSS